MYVFSCMLDKYIVKWLPSHASLELLTVTLHYRSCLSLFYRPPSSPADILYSLHSYFESFNIPQFSSFVLIGDFNINFFDTTHPSFGNLCNLMSTFGVTQVVDNYTHLYRDNCHSLIDLVLLSNPSFLSSCQTIPPLSNSDHLGVWVEIKMKHANKTVRPPPPSPPPPPLAFCLALFPGRLGQGT